MVKPQRGILGNRGHNPLTEWLFKLVSFSLQFQLSNTGLQLAEEKAHTNATPLH